MTVFTTVLAAILRPSRPVVKPIEPPLARRGVLGHQQAALQLGGDGVAQHVEVERGQRRRADDVARGHDHVVERADVAQQRGHLGLVGDVGLGELQRQVADGGGQARAVAPDRDHARAQRVRAARDREADAGARAEHGDGLVGEGGRDHVLLRRKVAMASLSDIPRLSGIHQNRQPSSPES